MMQKPIIQIIQKGERIPFDVSAQRTIEIDHRDLESVDKARKELERQIVAVEKNPTLVDSPITTALSIQSLRSSANPEQTAIMAIQATLSNLSSEIRYIRNKLEPIFPARWNTYAENLRHAITLEEVTQQEQMDHMQEEIDRMKLKNKRYEQWLLDNEKRNNKKIEESQPKMK